MSRFVLRYRGPSAAPRDEAEKIRSSPSLHVIDEAEKMFLVEGEESAVAEIMSGLDNWIVAREKVFTIPDPRPKLRKTQA